MKLFIIVYLLGKIGLVIDANPGSTIEQCQQEITLLKEQAGDPPRPYKLSDIRVTCEWHDEPPAIQWTDEMAAKLAKERGE